MKDVAEQMEKVTQGLIQACDEMNATCRQSMDAVMESTSVLTRGCEELSRKFGNLMQESMERTLSAGKTMMSAKSIKEIADLHAEFMKDYFEQWMTGTGKLSEISARVSQKAIEPVARHAGTAISKAAEKAQQGNAA